MHMKQLLRELKCVGKCYIRIYENVFDFVRITRCKTYSKTFLLLEKLTFNKVKD